MFLCIQVPEQDETYEEDSFVVNGSEVEEDFGSASDEEEEAGVEIVPEDSYVDGRRQYATRRSVHLRQTRIPREVGSLQSRKAKRSRIVRVEDSSEEEEENDTKRMMPHDEKAPVSADAPGTGFDSLPLSCLRKSDPTQAAGVKNRNDAVQEKQERDKQRFNNQALLSEELDFQEPLSTSPKTQVRSKNGLVIFKILVKFKMVFSVKNG